MKAPCYICGEPAVLDGLCADCYANEHPLIHIKSPISIVICKKCGSVKVPGKWQTVNSTTEPERIAEAIEIAIDLEIEVFTRNDIDMTIHEVNRLDRVVHTEIVVLGKSHQSLPIHEEIYPVQFRIQYGTCDTCGMISGGYYEATLQIRADERPVTEEEERDITSIVRERTHAEYGKDTKAFVIEIRSDRHGVDYFMGSEQLCRRVADEIQAAYLAERKTNYSLVKQEMGGKDKYRTTTLLRLPRFTIGDFIRVDGNPCVVLALGKGGLTCHDLEENRRFTTSPKSSKWRTIEFIKSGSSKREFMVISRGYEQPVQLMDSETYQTVEVDVEKIGDEPPVGNNLYMVEIEEIWYPLPPLQS